MFPLSLKATALAGVVAFALGNVTGWRVSKAFSDARWLKAQMAARDAKIAEQAGQIKARDVATTHDQQRAVAAEQARAAAEEKARELASRVPDDACFNHDDTGQLRQLWRPEPRRERGR